MAKENKSVEVRNIKLDLEEPESRLLEKAGKKLNMPASELKLERVLRKSIDARNKSKIQFVYNLELKMENLKNIKWGGDIIAPPNSVVEEINRGSEKLKGPLVVVGSGPAGMFAALELSKKGYRPILLERGKMVDQRDQDISYFFKNGALNLESNIQFGEGGAGTYSDGKLTTRIKDFRCDTVFETFVEMGAPEEILYSHKPHIGTDILKKVVMNLRTEIQKQGGSVRFNSKLTDVKINRGELEAIEINHGEWIQVGALILAIGHSSRDTYEMLFDRQVAMEAKPFAIGLRIEHEQKMLNEIQYGRFAEHPKLGAADYSLAMRSNLTGRSAYSFCMCPGGYVVGATSEENQVAVNGMSEFKRDGINANSALIVNVNPTDFGPGVLAGIQFQRQWERKAFEVGGGGYSAPVETVGGFLGVDGFLREKVLPTYLPGTTESKLELCLPEYVTLTLKDGLREFDRKLRGFGDSGAILTGVETRTSAPVRIIRDEECQSVNTKNLYPSGEGAGYAGGIVSAAVDGIRCAQNIIGRFSET